MVRLTRHARKRAYERLGRVSNKDIPAKAIRRAAKALPPGQRFYVTRNGFTFVCKATSQGPCILTVVDASLAPLRSNI